VGSAAGVSGGRAYFGVLRFEEAQRWAVWYAPEQDHTRNNRVDIYDDTWKQTAHYDIPLTIQFERGAPYPPEWVTRIGLSVAHKLQAMFGVVHGVCGLPVVWLVNPRVDRAAIGGVSCRGCMRMIFTGTAGSGWIRSISWAVV